MESSIVEHFLDYIVPCGFKIQIQAVCCCPNFRQIGIFCCNYSLNKSYILTRWQLDSCQWMFGQNLNDNSDSESQPQTERTVSQPKVHLKWKKVASRPSPCKNQSKTNFCRYLAFATIGASYFSNFSIRTIRSTLKEIRTK